MRREYLLDSVGALLVLQAAGALCAAAFIARSEMCLTGDSSQIYKPEFSGIFGRVNLSWRPVWLQFFFHIFKGNTMKKLFVVAALSGIALVPQAFAQNRNFEGFSVGLNATSSTVGTEATGTGVSGKFGDGSENFSLQAAYGVSMGGNGVLGLGGTYTLADFNAGNIASGATAVKLKGKDMYSLYVEPGFLVNPSTLVFAKAAYLSMKWETSLLGGTGASENFDGLGYGAGVRMSFGKTAYWQFELTQSDYNSKNVSALSLKPSAFNRTIGVGFRF